MWLGIIRTGRRRTIQKMIFASFEPGTTGGWRRRRVGRVRIGGTIRIRAVFHFLLGQIGPDTPTELSRRQIVLPNLLAFHGSGLDLFQAGRPLLL